MSDCTFGRDFDLTAFGFDLGFDFVLLCFGLAFNFVDGALVEGGAGEGTESDVEREGADAKKGHATPDLFSRFLCSSL
jgi:hypothetical protein